MACDRYSFGFDVCGGVPGDPFISEQDIWEEHYKLEEKVKNVEQSVQGVRNPLKSFYLQAVAQHETQAELVRQNGHSGLMKSRQYTYEYANDVGYAAANIHDHANFKMLCGSAEFTGALNGYYFRSRHNDYNLRKNGPVGGKYLKSGPFINTLPVPADVTGTPEQQINKIKDYFRALNGEIPQSSVAHFDKAFRWVLSYIECWWEVLKGPEFEDPFSSPRHKINADTIRDLVARDQYYSYGGHKNRYEDQAHLPIAIKDVDENGNPVFAIFKYRCMAKEIGSLVQYPINDIIEKVDDYVTKARGRDHDLSRAQRFRLKRRGYASFQGSGYIGNFMHSIYGLDGEGSSLTENYISRDGEDTLIYPNGNPLNAARYNDFYQIEYPDASGRNKARRGFHDPMLFVAKTTRPEVFTRNYDNYSYAFSYAIPFEMHVQTFLDEWNPYEVPEVAYKDISKSGKTGDSIDSPFPGFNDTRFYYHTPANLFTDVIDPDPADTSSRSKYVMCGDGQARTHVASGIWTFLPGMPGVQKRVRLRYPVYPVYWEGNEAHEQFKAYLHLNK